MGWFNWRNKSKSRTKSTLAPSRKDKPDNTWSDKHLERERKRLQALVDMGYGGKFGEEFKRDLKKVERIIEERELKEQKKKDEEWERDIAETARQAEEDYMMNNPGDMGYGQLKRKKKKKKTRRSKSKSRSRSKSRSKSRSRSKSNKKRTNKKRTKKKRTKKKRTKRNNLTKRR